MLCGKRSLASQTWSERLLPISTVSGSIVASGCSTLKLQAASGCHFDDALMLQHNIQIDSNRMSGNDTTDQPLSSSSDDEPESKDGIRSRWLAINPRKRFLLLIVACSLVIFLTSVGLWYANRQQEIDVEEKMSLSPSERFAEQYELVREQKLDTLHLSDIEVTDDMVTGVADLDWLTTLIFDQGIITDDGLETIVKLPRLQHLRLRLSPITDQGLKTVSSCDSLWYLNLPHADCTVDGVAHLQTLTKLRQLRLGSKRLGNDVAQVIAKLKGLRGIHLIGVPVTDDGLETLAEMPYLESLYLDDSAVTEAGWERLFREHPDLHVHVNQHHHDRDPKGHIHHD